MRAERAPGRGLGGQGTIAPWRRPGRPRPVCRTSGRGRGSSCSPKPGRWACPIPCSFLAGASQERALGLARKLLAKGQAYEKLRSRLFQHVTRDKTYGQISCVDTAGMNLGYTVDLADCAKDNPADFTLLKRATLQDLQAGGRDRDRMGQGPPELVFAAGRHRPGRSVFHLLVLHL